MPAICKYLQVQAQHREVMIDAWHMLLEGGSTWQSAVEANKGCACSTVGEACQNWSSLLQRPLGLYISLNDAVSGRAVLRSACSALQP